MSKARGRASDRDPSRFLSRRYLSAFALVVACVVINQALVQPPLLRMMTDAPRINLAGRQRMLSQRLTKAALAAERTSDVAETRAYLAEKDHALREWSSTHDSLSHDAATGQDGPIRRAFVEIEPSYLRLRDASRTGETGGILAAEAEYLSRMDRIVDLYETDASERAARLLWTGWGLAGLILVGLFAAGWLVLRPATRLIARQVRELGDARDELEVRVRERTVELEEANAHLERDAVERAEAETRHRAVLEMASHASRTNTLGEMASALAHELNQPLGAIANYAEGCLIVLERPAPDLDEATSAIRRILSTTLRAGGVISRIRRFVTRGGVEREPFEPNRVVREVVEILADEAARRKIVVREELASVLPLVWGDPVQVQQVLINLIRNAFDAMDSTEPDARSIVVETDADSGRVVNFAVTDRGEGISSELAIRIFEPYFSTRAGGMGMGLAISRTIVESHGGTLRVKPGTGGGTTFSFSLPVVGPENDARRHGLPG